LRVNGWGVANVTNATAAYIQSNALLNRVLCDAKASGHALDVHAADIGTRCKAGAMAEAATKRHAPRAIRPIRVR
jgi:hypothetical protein